MPERIRNVCLCVILGWPPLLSIPWVERREEKREGDRCWLLCDWIIFILLVSVCDKQAPELELTDWRTDSTHLNVFVWRSEKKRNKSIFTFAVILFPTQLHCGRGTKTRFTLQKRPTSLEAEVRERETESLTAQSTEFHYWDWRHDVNDR